MKTNYHAKSILMIILVLVCSIPDLAQQDERDAKRQERAERAKQLEAKLADVRSQFKTLGSKLKDASNQADSNLKVEMSTTRNELRDGYSQLKAT